jgi:hypothetical protein
MSRARLPVRSCDHGYNTTLADGSDKYKNLMNTLVRYSLSDTDDMCFILARNILLVDDNLLRKVVATGLSMGHLICSVDQQGTDKEQRLQRRATQMFRLAECIFGIELILKKNGLNSTNGMAYLQDNYLKIRANSRNLALCFLSRARCSCFQEGLINAKAEFDSDHCSHAGCSKGELPRKSLMDCAQCKMKPYCSADRQAKDWPVHKLTCKPVVAKEIPREWWNLMLQMK